MPDRRFDWFLIVLAIAVRAAAVLVLQSHTVPHSTYEHGEIAANLLAGRGFSVRFLGAEGPTSQQAPLYPALVAGAYAVGGVGTPRALLILELGQAALGGLLVAAVLRLAREVAPERRLARRALRADGRAAPDPGLRGDPRAGRPAGRDPDDGDPGLGLSRGPDGARSRRVGDGPLARGADADRPDPGARRRRGHLGRRAGPGTTAGAPAARDRGAGVGDGGGPLGRAELVGPRRVRRHQEHVRLRLLAGQLHPQPGDRQGGPRVGRAGPERGRGAGGAPRAQSDALGRPARGGIHRRHRAVGGRLPRAGLGLRARAVAPALPTRLRGHPGRSRPLCPALRASVAVFRPLRRDEPQDPERRLSGEPPGVDDRWPRWAGAWRGRSSGVGSGRRR